MEAPRKLTPELMAAIRALGEQGIPATERAVAKWIEDHAEQPGQAQRPCETPQAKPEAPVVADGNSRPDMALFTPAEIEELCQAEPKPACRSLLVAAGLTTPKGGRPPKEEPWLEEAAKLVAGGMTLREAMEDLGVPFSEQDLNNIQRLVRFRKYLEKHRQGR